MFNSALVFGVKNSLEDFRDLDRHSKVVFFDTVTHIYNFTTQSSILWSNVQVSSLQQGF